MRSSFSAGRVGPRRAIDAGVRVLYEHLGDRETGQGKEYLAVHTNRRVVLVPLAGLGNQSAEEKTSKAPGKMTREDLIERYREGLRGAWEEPRADRE